MRTRGYHQRKDKCGESDSDSWVSKVEDQEGKRMGREKVAFKMTRIRASGDDEGEGGRVRNCLSETSTADHRKKE